MSADIFESRAVAAKPLECIITAEWGNGFTVGQPVKNFSMNGYWDQNKNGQIDADEQSNDPFTLEDIYCAEPRNKSVVLVVSDRD